MKYPDMIEYITFLFFGVSGFPVMFHVEPASVNERVVLDTKKEKLIDRGTRCIVVDNGYVDKKRTTTFAESDVLLLTPKTTLEEANTLLGAAPLYTATQIETYQGTRKTAIEPVFDLLSNSCQSQGSINLYPCETWHMFLPFWDSVSYFCRYQC